VLVSVLQCLVCCHSLHTQVNCAGSCCYGLCPPPPPAAAAVHVFVVHRLQQSPDITQGLRSKLVSAYPDSVRRLPSCLLAFGELRDPAVAEAVIEVLQSAEQVSRDNNMLIVPPHWNLQPRLAGPPAQQQHTR